ncbi:MAG: hypothetical protein ACR2HH_13710 [Chthoniobacterales bacterium]
MKSKSLVILAIMVTSAVILSGVWFDHARSEQRRAAAAAAPQATRQTPPLPQWGALLPAGENVEVTGSAMCGYCTWRAGEPPDNIVLQTSTEPGIVFVLPNEQRAEMEKLTGRCAGGDYWITAHGTVTQYDGHNYLLVKNFDALKTK